VGPRLRFLAGASASVFAVSIAQLAPSAGALGSSFVVTPGPSAPGSRLGGVAALASNDVWAVGTFHPKGPGYDDVGLERFAEHFDGASWTQTPVAGTRFNDDNLVATAGASRSDVWAVGFRKRTGFKSPVTTLASHWDGSAWTEVATPVINGNRLSFAAVSAVAGNDVWAVGAATDTVSGRFLPYRTVVEHWDGVRWSLVSAPSPFNHPQLTGVSAVGAGDVWAVGSGGNDVATGVPVAKPIFLHFDGTRWGSIAPPANVGRGDNLLTGVSGVAATGDAWAVGSAPSGALIERRA
jgi:hypothetical protein